MMDWLRQQRFRLRGLFRRGNLEAEMAEEMRTHLEFEAAARRAQGLGEEEARHVAQRAFGGPEQAKERCRDEFRLAWLDHFAQDLRYAVRSLAKSPAFTLAAVMTLALGIGVNVALFSVVNMVGLRPLPLKDPEDLVRLAGRTARGDTRESFSYTEYLDYRDSNRSLEGLLATTSGNYIVSGWIASFEDEGAVQADPARDGRGSNLVNVRWVSDNYFTVLGSPLQLGRAFRPDEAAPGTAAPVVVLSHQFWTTRFRRDPRVIGRTFLINRQPTTVIGVASPEFSGHEAVPPAFWLPLSAWSHRPADYAPGGPEAFHLIGRLKPGVAVAQAKADLDTIAARRAAEFPRENAKLTVQLEQGLYFINLTRSTAGTVALSLIIFGFGLVLALACTNVANLVLARNITRQPEIGVRLALGASRGRIIRQLLTENLLLCVVGAALGLVLATWTLQLLLPVVVSRLPNDWALDTRGIAFFRTLPDLHVLGFTAFLTLGATLVTGLLPAWQASRRNLIATVRNEGHPIAGRLTPSRLRKLLVIGQVAISLALLACAGLLTRKLIALQGLDLGFDPEAIFSATLGPNFGVTQFDGDFRRALAAVRALPGVAASGVGLTPLRAGVHTRIRQTGLRYDGTERQVQSSFISDGAFETFGVPLRRGRTFREPELHSASRVVVISETLARRLWPQTDPVGQTLAVSERLWGARERPAAPEAFRVCEVIGVAADIQMDMQTDNHEVLYLPCPLDVWTHGSSLFVRPRQVTAASLAEIVSAAKTAGLNLQFDRRYSYWVEWALLPSYAFAVTSASLGLLALGMASVGFYGLMAFSVHQRVREIGMRMALGATSRQVVRLFVREGLGLVAVGLPLGLVGGGLLSLALSKLTAGFFNAFDPVAFTAVTLLFGVIAAFACWLPARRATKVNPMIALRCE